MRRIAGGFGLLEAARWYLDFGLVFSDMTAGGVFHLPAGAPEPVPLIPHRKGIGGLVRHAARGFVVAGRNVAYKGDDGSAAVLLEASDGERFFNDLTADGRGRVWAGSVAIDPLEGAGGGGGMGRLHRIELDGSSTVLADDVVTSNGLAADPADELVYHVDTGRRLVWQLPSDTERGEGRELFVSTEEYDGEPDGLAVAADGSVWVAMAGGGLVVAWDRLGHRVAEVQVPQLLATAVCFGGDDLRSLYVLTGSMPDQPDPAGGCVYLDASPVAGRPGAVARVAARSAASRSARPSSSSP